MNRPLAVNLLNSFVVLQKHSVATAETIKQRLWSNDAQDGKSLLIARR